MDLNKFWDKTSRSGECIEWTGARTHDGYGRLHLPGGKAPAYAHRVAYELTIGAIPEGMQVDHICRNRSCVNPAHLEPVTPEENFRRMHEHGNANRAKAQCRNGHEFTPENTYTYTGRNGWRTRSCRICQRATVARYKARKITVTLLGGAQ